MNFLDLFSGIGGFALGFEQVGYKFDYHGFSEIDKFATELYRRRFPNATELGSITDIQPGGDLPNHIDILCGGFPCQSFSIAGRRGGFNDTRGTLFFEIARILRHFRSTEKPIPHFVLENVKGLLNHEDGQTFALIYRVLTDLDYSVECQLLNTRWFLPQNRERIYLVGHFRGEPRSKIFPIGENGENFNTTQGKTQGERTRVRCNNTSNTITARYYKDGSENLIADYRTDEGVRIRQDGNSPTLTASHHSENEPSRMQGLVISHNLQQRSPNRPSKLEGQPGGSGHLSKEDGTTYCLEGSNLQAVEYEKSKIRRLTPIECERLQGFPDGWTEGQSDTQRYKQCGNAVSVPVVKAIMERLYETKTN